MRGRIQVRLSKPMSAIALVFGVAFMLIGLFVVIPVFGAFGVVWTLCALAITGYHAVNLFSEHGVAHEVVEFDASTQSETERSPEAPTEQRLRKLDELKTQGILDGEEYREQRKRILNEL